MSKVVFSGIQPTGNLHIGNYIGAVKHWVEAQNEEGLHIYCVVDMHAITVEQDAEALKQGTMDMSALLLAAGIDTEKSILFVQSQNHDHANLAWIMNCNVSMGEMNRMTQFKEKSEKKDFVSVGLFDYPALMAADILLYDTTDVPIGDDQKQHVELARDIAERFNGRYGETFVVPNPVIPKTGARIMSLQDPTKKMSKSDPNINSRIGLLDSEDDIRKKIGSAVTDSGNEVKYSKDKPGVSNLMEIYAHMADKSMGDIENEFRGKSYGDFKTTVADSIVNTLKPLQEKYNNLKNSGEVEQKLNQGAQKARDISGKKLKEVYDKVGFIG